MQTFTDVFRNRFILVNLVQKEFKGLYRSMALGFMWSLVQPLVLVTVLGIVWTVFFGTDKSFVSMVVVALIPYNFFNYSLSGCTASIFANHSLVKKVKFPRQILPISVICTHAIHFALQAMLILLVLLLIPPDAAILGWQLLWLPAIVLVQVGLIIGAGLLVSALYVVYRDVKYIVDSVMVVLFWGSPLIYDAHEILFERRSYPAWLPDWAAYVYYLNPLAGILDAYRAVLFHGRAPDPITFAMATGVTLVVGYVGVKWFWVHEREFADLI